MRIYRESTLHVQCTYLEYGMSMCFCRSGVERDRWTMRIYRESTLHVQCTYLEHGMSRVRISPKAAQFENHWLFLMYNELEFSFMCMHIHALYMYIHIHVLYMYIQCMHIHVLYMYIQCMYLTCSTLSSRDCTNLAITTSGLSNMSTTCVCTYMYMYTYIHVCMHTTCTYTCG